MNTKPLVTKYKFTKYKVSSIDTVEGAKHYRQQRSAHLGRRRHSARRCRRRRRRRCSVPEQLASLWPGITLLPVPGVDYFILITKHLLNTEPFFLLGHNKGCWNAEICSKLIAHPVKLRDGGSHDRTSWQLLDNIDSQTQLEGSLHFRGVLFLSVASKKCILILWCGVLIRL